MLNRILLGLCLVAFAACGDDSADGAKEAPAAADTTTKHPNGMVNGSVISTDTAAMRVVDSTDNE